MPWTSEQIKQLKQHRRAQGLCTDCGKVRAVSAGRCAHHADVHRRHNRLWMRRTKGCVPAYVATHPRQRKYATASNAEAWEYRAGYGVMRIWVDWRDPLMVLMARESQGWFQFLGRPSPVTTPRVSYA